MYPEGSRVAISDELGFGVDSHGVVNFVSRTTVNITLDVSRKIVMVNPRYVRKA